MLSTSSFSSSKPQVFSTLFFCFILLLLSQPVKAQGEYGTTPLALSPGAPTGSYALSDIDTVNLFNGHVNVRMPILASEGRGSAKGQITFNWGSPASWHVRSDVDGNGYPIHYAEQGGGSGVSTDGLSMGVAQVYGVQAGSPVSNYCHLGAGYYTYQKTLTRLYFVEPDGTEHEMRDVQTGGQPIPISVCALNGPSRGKVFVSTDGSGATFVADANVLDYAYAGGDFPLISPPGYLLLRNGTRYRVNDGIDASMRDRNGNQLSVTNVNSWPVFQYQIKDSINRPILRDYLAGSACATSGSGTSCEKISYKGFNGSNREIWLNYGAPMRLVLPNGLAYQFHLNQYGDLIRIDLPTGGSIEYDYGPGFDGPQPDVSGWIQGAIPGTYMMGLGAGVVYRRVTERRVYREGHVLENRQTFSKPEYFDSSFNPYNLGYVEQKQYDGSGLLLNSERHFFYGAASNSFSVSPIEYPAWKEGREYHSEFYDQNGILVRQTNQTWEQRAAVPWWTGSPDAAPQNDPRLSQSSTVLETGQTSTTINGYDATVPYNSLTDMYQYDSTGALLRHTRTTFVKNLNGADYTGTNIQNPNLPYMRDLPQQVSVFDGSTERSRTTFEYDNYLTDATHAGIVPRSAISGLDPSFTASYAWRGNITGVTNFLLTNGTVTGSVSAYSQYDVAGNVVKSIDARGFATTIEYADSFGAPNGDARLNTAPTELTSVGQSGFAFPTWVKNALNHTTYNQFDYYLGRPVDTEDPNAVVSSASFNDPLDRSTQVIRAANQSTTIKSQASFSYNDISRTVTTTSDLTSFNDTNPLKTQTVYDSLGRTIETREYEGGSNYIAKQVQYDALGRAFKNSNPFRPWQGETALWTTTAFDALGRILSVTTPDNASVTSVYTGNSTTVTDPAGKQHKTVKDALGRPIQAYEAPNDLSYNYLTSYSYDVQDNLITVSQHNQTRTFVYDSLKRLTSATNPESGTVTYGYDNNGNLTQKTDARVPAVTTTFAYDALNRVTSKSYNDNPQTPTVSYFYDAQSLPAGAPSFDRGSATGRLVAVTYGSGSSAGTYRGYDVMGRVVRQYQRTDSVNYLVEATYNRASHMVSQTYPSVPGAGDRRTVTYTPDAAGRLASLSTSATSYAPAASVSSISYASHNGLKTETYGNNLIHAVSYNSRLQPNEIKLGTSGAPTSIVSITYNYGTTNNNGNLQTTSYSVGGFSYTQTFGYDPLNRLTTSQEGTGWSQTNSYDRYGNRSVVGGALTFSPNTNRITNAGYVYDGAGNLTNDTAHTYTFDGENKISKVDNIPAYVYDGEGQRVRKLVNENLRFIYGIDGQQIAEFSAANGNLIKEYIYCASGLVATIEPTAVNANGARYTTSDHLGSPRIVTSLSAGVVSRHDYMPFGEELFGGGRTPGIGYGVADGLRQKFTSKERDNETGLDFFSARYYASTQGRFVSVDPLGASAIVSDPQSFNRYTYVLNNPLKYVDPDGLNAHNPWGSLTDEERKLLASKLTTVTGKDQMKAAQDVFNNMVTVNNQNGTLNQEQTNSNIASVQNFVGSLAGDSKVWNQIQSIDKVNSAGGGKQSDINFTVHNRRDFLLAVTELKDSSGHQRFAYFGSEMGHKDSTRGLGYGVTDPSMHIERDGGNHMAVHWDASSPLTKNTWKELALDTMPGGLARRGVAGLYHWYGPKRASTDAVRDHMKAEGLVPRH